MSFNFDYAKIKATKTYLPRKRAKSQLIPNIANLCRLCLNKIDAGLDIYPEKNSESLPLLVTKIMMCTGIEVQKCKDLPNKLCLDCVREINNCYNYRKVCEVAYQKIKLHLQALEQVKIKVDSIHDNLLDNRNNVQNDGIEKSGSFPLSPWKDKMEKDNEKNEMIAENGTLDKINVYYENFTEFLKPNNEINNDNNESEVVTNSTIKNIENDLPNDLITNYDADPKSSEITETNENERNPESQQQIIQNENFTQPTQPTEYSIIPYQEVNEENIVKEPIITDEQPLYNINEVNVINSNTNNEQNNENQIILLKNKFSKTLINNDESNDQRKDVTINMHSYMKIDPLQTIAAKKTKKPIPAVGVLICNFMLSKLVESKLVEMEGDAISACDVGTIQLATPFGDVDMEIVEEDVADKKSDAPIQKEKPKPKPEAIEVFQCYTCGARLRGRSSLKRHMARHVGTKPYGCDLCHRTFAQRSTLRRHQLIHSDSRPYPCTRCSKSFTQKHALLAHERVNHTEVSSLELHVCPTCDKIFLHGSGLTRHMKTHAGTFDTCKDCKKVFTDSSSFKRHQNLCKSRAVVPTNSISNDPS